MKITSQLSRAVLALGCSTVLVACGSPEPAATAPSSASLTPASESTPPPPPPADQGLALDTPLDTSGPRDATCPYLDDTFVADTNGQRVLGTTLDRRFDVPACIYWSYPPEPQLQVLVRHVPSAADAMAVVDWAAPVESTELAEEIPGWSGGRGATAEGAIYAVAKGKVAVVVWTNQTQSLKAQLVAEQVIANLGL